MLLCKFSLCFEETHQIFQFAFLTEENEFCLVSTDSTAAWSSVEMKVQLAVRFPESSQEGFRMPQWIWEMLFFI